MAINSELEKQVETLSKRINNMNITNSRMKDEIAELKHAHIKLTDDVSKRFKAVHEKLFR